MAGDPVCDAFRTKLQAILAAAAPPIAWDVEDTDNGVAAPDAGTPYIQMRFEGGDESRFTFGSPGSDYFTEIGDVFIDFLVPLGGGREAQERNARTVREAFASVTHRFFYTSVASGSIRIEITNASPLGAGQGVDGAMSCKTIGLSYRIYNVR